MTNLIERDLKHIWHPCGQMKDYETFKPLEIVAANGCRIQLKNGQQLIDATASWWCKSLGHAHPRLREAMLQQLKKFEHVMFAHTTHDIIVTLAEKLAGLTQTLKKMSFASDGSSAVEMAMKMSLHARQVMGEPERCQFVALENGYHGETIGALSVSDRGIYRDPYRALLFEVTLLSPLPYVLNESEVLWSHCETEWLLLEKKLNACRETLTAIIIEPIVQGAGGMRIYSQDFLRRLRAWTKQHQVHLIADEIMTGIGRTGKMLACEHAGIEPDFLCLSKGLTSGVLPLSVMLTTDALYALFYADYASGQSFLHSHTHAGNALAAAVALEVLTIFSEENILGQVQVLGEKMLAAMMDIAARTGRLINVRQLGAVVAADMLAPRGEERFGFAVYQKAAALGALLRPLGNTVYWVPPLIMDELTLQQLKEVTEKAIFSQKP